MGVVVDTHGTRSGINQKFIKIIILSFLTKICSLMKINTGYWKCC